MLVSFISLSIDKRHVVINDWKGRKSESDEVSEPGQFDLQLRYDIEPSLRLSQRLNDGLASGRMRGSQWQLKQ